LVTVIGCCTLAVTVALAEFCALTRAAVPSIAIHRVTRARRVANVEILSGISNMAL
jgi:hypothetical protein